MTRSDLSCRRCTLPLALLVLAAIALGSLVTSAPALATSQKSCARQIIEDWYDNERVDRFYPLHCYHEAIDSLGPDAKNYTNLPDAILRALAYRQANQKDPGDNGTGAGGPNGVKPVAYRHTADLVVALPGGQTAAGAGNGSSNPSSVPIPLIVLAGLAGLLLIAGGAGYVARRVQGRGGDDGPPSDEL